MLLTWLLCNSCARQHLPAYRHILHFINLCCSCSNSRWFDIHFTLHLEGLCHVFLWFLSSDSIPHFPLLPALRLSVLCTIWTVFDLLYLFILCFFLLFTAHFPHALVYPLDLCFHEPWVVSVTSTSRPTAITIDRSHQHVHLSFPYLYPQIQRFVPTTRKICNFRIVENHSKKLLVAKEGVDVIDEIWNY